MNPKFWMGKLRLTGVESSVQDHTEVPSNAGVVDSIVYFLFIRLPSQGSEGAEIRN